MQGHRFVNCQPDELKLLLVLKRFFFPGGFFIQRKVQRVILGLHTLRACCCRGGDKFCVRSTHCTHGIVIDRCHDCVRMTTWAGRSCGQLFLDVFALRVSVGSWHTSTLFWVVVVGNRLVLPDERGGVVDGGYRVAAGQGSRRG